MRVIYELIEHLAERGLLTEQDRLGLAARGFLPRHEAPDWGADDDEGDGETEEGDALARPTRRVRQCQRTGAFRARARWLTLGQVAGHIERCRSDHLSSLDTLLALSDGPRPGDEIAALRELATTEPAALADRLARAYEREARTLSAVWSALAPWDLTPDGVGPAVYALRSFLRKPSRVGQGDAGAWVLRAPAIAWAVQAERAKARVARAHRFLFDGAGPILTRALVRSRCSAAYVALSLVVTARCTVGHPPCERIEPPHPIWLQRFGRQGVGVAPEIALAMLEPSEALALAGLFAEPVPATAPSCAAQVRVSLAAWHRGLSPGPGVLDARHHLSSVPTDLGSRATARSASSSRRTSATPDPE